MKRLNKSIDEYLAQNGWSSVLFKAHAVLAFTELQGKAEFKIGRTVIHIIAPSGIGIKAYVHHNGRSAEYLTFTTLKGVELNTFHHSISPQDVLTEIISLLCI